MLAWGFILLVGGLIACLGFFFSEMSDIIAVIGNGGVGRYVRLFFDPEKLTTQKVVFVIAAVLAVIGLVCFSLGRIRRKKSGADKNPIIPAKVTKYLRDTKGEFKKITWPTIPVTLRNTGVVLAMCAVTAAVIILADAGLSWIIDLMLGQ